MGKCAADDSFVSLATCSRTTRRIHTDSQASDGTNALRITAGPSSSGLRLSMMRSWVSGARSKVRRRYVVRQQRLVRTGEPPNEHNFRDKEGVTNPNRCLPWFCAYDVRGSVSGGQKHLPGRVRVMGINHGRDRGRHVHVLYLTVG